LLFPFDAESRDELRDGGTRAVDKDATAAKAETRQAGVVDAKRDIATTVVARTKRRRRMPPKLYEYDFLWLLQPPQLYVETETPAVANAGWLTTKSDDSGFILAENWSVIE
jgi:hypothetical protein